MHYSTKVKLLKYSATLPPSDDRGKCISMANSSLNGRTIAGFIVAISKGQGNILRTAQLFANAGAAIETKKEGSSEDSYGTFVFEDGSTIQN